MACLFFVMVTVHFNGGMSLRESRAVNYLDLGAGSRVATFSDRAQEMENHLAGVTFDWTNHSGFAPGMHPSTGIGPTNLTN
jgi:hypothetical protein